MRGTSGSPAHADLVDDLVRLRESGLLRLRSLNLPALRQAAETLDLGVDPAPATEVLLRRAVERLGGGPFGDAADKLLGLGQGLRGLSGLQRRELAAQAVERSVDTFRKRYERDMLSAVADQVLALLAEERLRETRLQLERRHPAESRLAVHWVERFEAYNRIWTPAWGLAADLTAYRATLLEQDRPYDRDPGTHGPDDPGYTQELQAEGYAKFALFRFAWFASEVRQFMMRHGGLWLLSNAEAETEIADVVYRVTWHASEINERDLAWLRGTYAQSGPHEMSQFLHIISTTGLGRRTLQEWLSWVESCGCTWDPSADESDTESSHFPIADTHSGVTEGCQVHQVITACGRYCDIVDEEWARIADWYHLQTPRRRGVSAGGLYAEHVRRE